MSEETTFTIKTNDIDEARRLLLSNTMYSIVFELKHNFWRKYKHREGVSGQEVLDDLNEYINSELEEIIDGCF